MRLIDLVRTRCRASKTEKGVRGQEGVGPAERAIANWKRLSTGLFVFASNILATLLVVVAGVAFCRQVVQWWRESGPPAPSISRISSGKLADEFSGGRGETTGGLTGAAEAEADVLLGTSPWMWSRRMVRGESAQAAQCLGDLTAAKVAEIASGSAILGASLPPIDIDFSHLEGGRNLWQIREVGNFGQVWILPWEISVSLGVVQGVSKIGEDGSKKGKLQAVAFGIVRPRGEKIWELDLFSWAGNVSADWKDSPERIPEWATSHMFPCRLPADAKLLLACTTPLFGGQVTFRGTGPVESWMEFFDQAAPVAGWRAESEWQRIQTVWRRVFHPLVGGGDSKLEVLLSPTGEGDYYGLILWWIGLPSRNSASGGSK